MSERSRWQAVRAVVGCLAVIASGCGSDAGFSPTASTPVPTEGGIEIDPAGAIAGTAVTFQSLGASEPGWAWSWDFGDSSVGSGEHVSHAYDTPGVYVATVFVRSNEGLATQATLNVTVRDLTADWRGDDGLLSITQDGLDLLGSHEDHLRRGVVEGRVSPTGTVSFTVTTPGLEPVTFTGTAGPDVRTLVGVVTGRDGVARPRTLTRE